MVRKLILVLLLTTSIALAQPPGYSGAGGTSLTSYTQVTSLFSGCSGTQYLGYDGNCHTASGGSGSAGASIFNINSSTTITSTSATSLLGGAQTIASGYFVSNTPVAFDAGGYYTVPAAYTGTITIAVFLDGSQIATTGAMSVPATAVTNGTWSVQCQLTTYSTGSSGTYVFGCPVLLLPSSTATITLNGGSLAVASTPTINTTTSHTIDLKWTWSTATGSPSVTGQWGTATVGGAPVVSITGDGSVFCNSASTGAVTLSLCSPVNLPSSTEFNGTVLGTGATATIANYLAKTGGTMTGTITGADASTWGSTGFSCTGVATCLGSSTATTQSAGDNSTKVSTTAFVQTSMTGSTSEGKDGFWSNGMKPNNIVGTSAILTTGAPTLGTGYVQQFVPDHNYVIGHAGFYVATTQTSDILYACVYTSTSSAAVWSASVAITGSGTNAIASASQYTLQAGTLYYLLTGNYGSASAATLEVWSGQNNNGLTMLSGQGTWIGTAANGLSGATCPSTTGTITSSAASSSQFPAVLFGP